MCPPDSNPSGEAPRVGPSVVDGSLKEIRLPSVLQSLVDGLRAGHGTTSVPSLSMSGGARPDLVPIVVCTTPGPGFTTFLTALATLYALREEATGDVILTLSYSLDGEALTSLLASSRRVGKKGGITFEISMRAPGPDGTFRST